LVQLVSFFGYVFQAAVYLRHWPSYNNPDPKLLGWWLQHNALVLDFSAVPVFSLLAVVLAGVGRARSRDFPFWSTILLTAGSFVLLVVYARTDPGGFMDWFWD
jgi:hypothetical protein